MRSQFTYISVYYVGHAPYLPTYLPKQFTMEMTNQRLKDLRHMNTWSDMCMVKIC